MKKLGLVSLMSLSATVLFAQGEKLTTSEYIDKYKDIAIEEMVEYKIPASITMAQAIFESSAGNSPLAVKSNNHFGIKCKPEWTGDTVKHDDDEIGECFRKYDTILDSYKDHSLFLAKRVYYKDLFTLDILDYAGWANGLKKAGYATNPLYAQRLIDIIDQHQLYLLDDIGMAKINGEVVENNSVNTQEPEIVVAETVEKEGWYTAPVADPKDFLLDSNDAMPVYVNNRVKFVFASEGDTFEILSQKLGIKLSKLLQYNDMNESPVAISEGAIVYIKPKKLKSRSYNSHLVLKGQTLHEVSQRYGIKMASLAKNNYFDTDYQIKPGQKIKLSWGWFGR